MRLTELRQQGRRGVRALRRRRAGTLAGRVRALEEEVQECRQLNLRVAELTDLVEELLLPVAAQDETKVAELVDRYQRSL